MPWALGKYGTFFRNTDLYLFFFEMVSLWVEGFCNSVICEEAKSGSW